MNKNIIIGIVAVVLVIGGFVYYKNSNQGDVAAYPQTSDTVAVAGSNVVTLTDNGYSPSTLTIKKGETVTFKNQSSKSMWTASSMHPAHTEYSGTSLSEHCPDVANTSFDACRGYLSGESWSFTFDKVGTWGYHNHLSPKEWGTVVVQ